MDEHNHDLDDFSCDFPHMNNSVIEFFPAASVKYVDTKIAELEKRIDALEGRILEQECKDNE
jgi:hypothetical protein